jgi:hypothetical protein
MHYSSKIISLVLTLTTQRKINLRNELRNAITGAEIMTQLPHQKNDKIK